MTPEEQELLKQLEAATDQPSSNPESEAPLLREGWRVLDQSLRTLTPESLPPAFSVLLTGRIQTRERLRRQRQIIRKVAWISAAVVLVASSLFVFVSTRERRQITEEPRPDLRVALPKVSEPRDSGPPVNIGSSYDWPTPDTVSGNSPDAAWDGIDSNLSQFSAEVEGLQSRWRLSTGYLDYVAKRFQELEYEMAITKL